MTQIFPERGFVKDVLFLSRRVPLNNYVSLLKLKHEFEIFFKLTFKFLIVM